ncbi:diacylglycerol kinase [Candidatus Marinamargulisbacteria bacterium SCGC AG-343-D04]|nr:diacylglycerol kinase [Candidatus Marinamargulisbacteria bacterium SCGC AG-343-D04]
MILISIYKKFSVAISGICHAIKTESSMKVHLLFTLILIALFFFLDFSVLESSIVLLCIGTVISFELLNTALENTVDLISNKHLDAIKHIKDMSAGAVLTSVFVSILVGCMIIVPKCLTLLKLWKDTV